VMTCSMLSAIIAAVAAKKKILKSRFENEVKARCWRAVNVLGYLDRFDIAVNCSGKSRGSSIGGEDQ
jgi:hypothetical protein